jgi:hypothetical protein
MSRNFSDADFSDQKASGMINEANRVIPAIDCDDKGGGKRVCKWTDHEGREHALYYNKQTEFLHFNHESNQWIALLKNAEDSLTPRATKTTPDRAERDGFNVRAQERDSRRCKGEYDGLCPQIDGSGTIWTYTWNGEKFVVDSTKERLIWSQADNTYIVILTKLL